MIRETVLGLYNKGYFIIQMNVIVGLFGLLLFERGLNGRTLCWSERLRWCWQILRYGKPWSDFIILNTENQKQLKDFLSEVQKL